MKKSHLIVLLFFDFLRQFGLKYLICRSGYEVLKKTGFLKLLFPKTYIKIDYPTCKNWKKEYGDRFFVPEREKVSLFVKDEPFSPILKEQTIKIINGEIPFFSSEWKYLGFDNEWNIHPISKYRYPQKHWTELLIYSAKIGDIKYVWEKSKFSYLLYLIRNDAKHNEDHSKFVFDEISRWIDANPPNIGPHYICSQEISIRLLNWSFALFFYQNSEYLSEEFFKKIFASIDIQLKHVYDNINFSKIFVRNNHAITETLTLYLMGLYYPFLKYSKKYKKYGKKWFEEEIDFQLLKDGSDSQYSFNYHRVKIQLFTWAVASAEIHNERFSDRTYNKIFQTVNFLYQMMGNTDKGLLPNFGANDCSLYFKINDNDYQNFYPQLYALSSILGINVPFIKRPSLINEDLLWYTQKIRVKLVHEINLNRFKYYPDGGYVIYRDDSFFMMFKTPEYKFRVGQDDYFHIDLWVNGINLLKDSGSYMYNLGSEVTQHFNGAEGHNTVTVNNANHLKKSINFIWQLKPKHIFTKIEDSIDQIRIISRMKVMYPEPCYLERKITKCIKHWEWVIEDRVITKSKNNLKIMQYWNVDMKKISDLEWQSRDENSKTLTPEITIGSYSIYYGSMASTKKLKYESSSKMIQTSIKFNKS